jgi:protein tyrosine phosphatase
VFIHDALEELITCGDTSISSSNLRTYIRKMHKIIPEKAISGFTDQFRLLKKVSRLPIDSDLSDALEPYNKEKNRYPSRIPYNMNRARLRPTGVSGAEYINASFLDGYKQRNAYIATQAPLRNTVNDFWRMMWEYQCGCIVMLCELEEDGEESSYRYWPEEVGEVMVCGMLRVRLRLVNSDGDIVERRLEVTAVEETVHQSISTNTLIVSMVQLISWPKEGLPHFSSITSIIEHLTFQLRASSKPAVVMCSDGVTRTGTFICIHSQLERLKTEGVVDVFQAINSACIQRPGLIPNLVHYVFCYEVLADFVERMEAYHNFKTLM